MANSSKLWAKNQEAQKTPHKDSKQCIPTQCQRQGLSTVNKSGEGIYHIQDSANKAKTGFFSRNCGLDMLKVFTENHYPWRTLPIEKCSFRSKEAMDSAIQKKAEKIYYLYNSPWRKDQKEFFRKGILCIMSIKKKSLWPIRKA